MSVGTWTQETNHRDRHHRLDQSRPILTRSQRYSRWPSPDRDFCVGEWSRMDEIKDEKKMREN